MDLFFLPGNHLYPVAQLSTWKDATVLMVEDAAICRRFRYHQQKLALLLGAMRDHRHALQAADFKLTYYELDKGLCLRTALRESIAQTNADRLLTFAISDHNLTRLLTSISQELDIPWVIQADPGFITTTSAFRDYAGDRSSLRMADFYRKQRIELNILVAADEQPQGGQWSFDTENRKKVPKKLAIPQINKVKHTPAARSAMQDVAEYFSDHPGRAADLWLPTSRQGAVTWLDDFLTQRFDGFGTYEDAISSRSATLFHSALSPLINLGLLTPSEVVAAALQHAADNNIAMNDLEGFIRQIIGWREFIRGVYDTHYDKLVHTNTRQQTRQLTQHWHDGTTGLAPLDMAIETQQRLGWNHHINRLMVIANLMNLCEIDPRTVYEYFMQYYVDAYDWVMVPNVYGMGLNSDGGVFATKPYICGSNYLRKMSDLPKGEWCDTVDGLYWRFIGKHRKALAQNPRLAAFVSGVDRLSDTRKATIFAAAEEFLQRCTTN